MVIITLRCDKCGLENQWENENFRNVITKARNIGWQYSTKTQSCPNCNNIINQDTNEKVIDLSLLYEYRQKEDKNHAN